MRRHKQDSREEREEKAANFLAPAGNEVIAVDWKGLKDVDQINMDSTSSLHGSSLHRPSTEVRSSLLSLLVRRPLGDSKNGHEPRIFPTHSPLPLQLAWSFSSLWKSHSNIPDADTFLKTLLLSSKCMPNIAHWDPGSLCFPQESPSHSPGFWSL